MGGSTSGLGPEAMAEGCSDGGWGSFGGEERIYCSGLGFK